MKTTRTISPTWAWSIAGLSILLVAIGILLSVVAVAAAGEHLGLFSHLLTIPISGAIFAALGALVLASHPRHPIAWILVGLGLMTGIEVLNIGYLAFASQAISGGVLAAPDISLWMLFWLYIPRAVIPITLLILLFPNGKLPSRHWRPIGWAAVLSVLLVTVSLAFSPAPGEASSEAFGATLQNPFALQSQVLGIAGGVGGGLLAVAFVGSVASVIIRFRRAGGIGQQQMKWMTYSMGIVLLALVMGVTVFATFPGNALAVEITYGIGNLAFISIAVAASIAVLRYRLYDIDVIISRTLVYGALTVLVIGLYIVVVGSLGAIFQARGSLLISLVATGLIAVLFQPMRDRLQRGANRLLYGERDEPYDVLSQLGRQLEGPAAPEQMLTSIVETVAQTLKLPYVAIALPNDQTQAIAREYGRPTGEQIVLPLKYQGIHVGQLICAPRGPREPFTDPEERLLRDIANQAAVSVHALRLSAALQRSRERLVSAREEERRRLRRDLHDGLGPQLASLALKLDAARNQLQDDPKVADAILLQLRWQAKDAIADIRRLIYNLRPPALDELGLLPALRASAVAQFSSGRPRVVVEGPESMPALPAAVEVAAYRIAQEAVTNVARHAHAEHCYVRLHLENGLELEVEDDGDGLPETLRPGVGLNSMQERTAELGGRFRIEGLPEGGARVIAQIPLSRLEA